MNAGARRPWKRAGPPAPSAVVLAAGSSSRFPDTKQLEQISGKTLLERVVEAVPRKRVRETVLVLGHEAAAVERAVSAREGLSLVVNADYRSGMGSSIRAGILALAKDTSGAMLLLADQPFVKRALLLRMLRAFEARGAKGIVAAAYGELTAPPVIFSRRYFRELTELKGDQGAKSVIERHARAVSLVRVRSRATLADVDTWEDFEAARRLLES